MTDPPIYPAVGQRDPESSRVATEIAALAQQDPQKVRLGIPLHELTTLRIGGQALGVCKVRTIADAQRFQAFAHAHDVPLTYLGWGSNVLADDRGFCGLILHLENANVEVRGDAVHVGAGLGFDELIVHALEAGLTGLEFASGIPGTVGGAVVGNAGCYGHEISEFLVTATILRQDGCLETVGAEDLAFSYRSSALKEGSDLLLEVVLRLTRTDVAKAWRTREEKIHIRRLKHPVDRPCAGSYFKNLPADRPGAQRRAAGELLDLAGAKAFRCGDAAVFEKHANIIVNEGCATSADVLTLAARMKAAVQQKFGVLLEEEVRYLPWLSLPV